MKIYTRGGDQGQTSLRGGVRVRKDAPRPEAYGTVDELNSLLGLARSEPLPPEMHALLGQIQSQLFSLGAQLAAAKPTQPPSATVGPHEIENLEAAIDTAEGQLRPLSAFILPGGTRGAALLHVARTVCRRAERRVVSLVEHEPALGTFPIAYLNRLGDLLFVLARLANAHAGQADIAWPLAPGP
jgi:cob(I)alamin adenosyltransferase